MPRLFYKWIKIGGVINIKLFAGNRVLSKQLTDMMKLHPSTSLSKDQTESRLKLVIADGMAAEAMVVLTSGTFLTAMAITLGATNFQLGLFAALPTFTTIFQLAAIWLVQRFNNRRVITSLFNLLARLPIIAIGLQHIFGDIAKPFSAVNITLNIYVKPGFLLRFFYSF